MFVRRICIIFIFCVAAQLYAQDSVDKKTCQIHVYVHGTYGSAFSFISLPWVKKDALKGTTYVSLQRKMRSSQLAQYRRLMGDHGLTEVTPGICLPETHPIHYVADALRLIHREVNVHDTSEQRHFLFGWSGLLSQHERRYASIRLYNELVALVERVKAEGKIPVLKLYAHSHGGNVLLNLALVDACAFDLASLPPLTQPDVVSSMQKLFIDGAEWYKKPTQRLQASIFATFLATPVQQETAPLVVSPFFTRVLHIYSENDGIMASDFISSSRQSVMLFDDVLVQGHASIKTIRWMNGRTPLDDSLLEPLKKSRLGPLKNLSRKRINRIKNGGGNPDCPYPNDPTHADFWSVGNKRDGAFFEEVPLLIYMPLVEHLLPMVGDAQRLDFCLTDEDDSIGGALFAYNDQQKPELKAMKLISNEPLLEARQGIQEVLNVSKKLTINVKLTLPF